MAGLNTYSNHAPKSEWLSGFFEHGSDFFRASSLGSEQIPFFKKFLHDAELLEDEKLTATGQLCQTLGWNTADAQGIILNNLVANNRQIAWYVKNLVVGQALSREGFKMKLYEEGQKKDGITSIIGAFSRLSLLPLGTVLKFSQVYKDGKETYYLRTPCAIDNPLVLLYALYTFAERCNGFWEFSLTRLLQHDIDQDGISPTEIFGLTREDMQPLLLGLAANYPAFIGAAFTHDLDKITLNSDKTSADVLDLF